MSNWEHRPLRKSQMHYAALDAFVLIDIYEKLKDAVLDQNGKIEELKSDLMMIKKSPNKSDNGLAKKQMKQEDEKAIKIPEGPKLILTDSLKASFPLSNPKFYLDSMMKNLMKILVYYKFD